MSAHRLVEKVSIEEGERSTGRMVSENIFLRSAQPHMIGEKIRIPWIRSKIEGRIMKGNKDYTKGIKNSNCFNELQVAVATTVCHCTL